MFIPQCFAPSSLPVMRQPQPVRSRAPQGPHGRRGFARGLERRYRTLISNIGAPPDTRP